MECGILQVDSGERNSKEILAHFRYSLFLADKMSSDGAAPATQLIELTKIFL